MEQLLRSAGVTDGAIARTDDGWRVSLRVQARVYVGNGTTFLSALHRAIEATGEPLREAERVTELRVLEERERGRVPEAAE